MSSTSLQVVCLTVGSMHILLTAVPLTGAQVSVNYLLALVSAHGAVHAFDS